MNKKTAAKYSLRIKYRSPTNWASLIRVLSPLISGDSTHILPFHCDLQPFTMKLFKATEGLMEWPESLVLLYQDVRTM